MSIELFHQILIGFSAVGLLVFIALFFVKAGYGMFRTAQWGFSIPNKIGWLLMEAPVFFVMLFCLFLSSFFSCLNCIISSVLLSFLF